MSVTIEDRVAQLGAKLGPELKPIRQLALGVRLASYYNAVILEVDGEAYVLSEATVGDKFLATPE